MLGDMEDGGCAKTLKRDRIEKDVFNSALLAGNQNNFIYGPFFGGVARKIDPFT